MHGCQTHSYSIYCRAWARLIKNAILIAFWDYFLQTQNAVIVFGHSTQYIMGIQYINIPSLLAEHLRVVLCQMCTGAFYLQCLSIQRPHSTHIEFCPHCAVNMQTLVWQGSRPCQLKYVRLLLHYAVVPAPETPYCESNRWLNIVC